MTDEQAEEAIAAWRAQSDRINSMPAGSMPTEHIANIRKHKQHALKALEPLMDFYFSVEQRSRMDAEIARLDAALARHEGD